MPERLTGLDPDASASELPPHPPEIDPVEVALDVTDTVEGACDPGAVDLSVAEQVLLDDRLARDAQHGQQDGDHDTRPVLPRGAVDEDRDPGRVRDRRAHVVQPAANCPVACLVLLMTFEMAICR